MFQKQNQGYTSVLFLPLLQEFWCLSVARHADFGSFPVQPRARFWDMLWAMHPQQLLGSSFVFRQTHFPEEEHLETKLHKDLESYQFQYILQFIQDILFYFFNFMFRWDQFSVFRVL